MAFTDILDDLISTSGQAFQSYQASQNPTSFVPLQPGTYVGSNGQVITANTPITSGGTGIILLLGLLAVFVFAFMALRK